MSGRTVQCGPATASICVYHNKYCSQLILLLDSVMISRGPLTIAVDEVYDTAS